MAADQHLWPGILLQPEKEGNTLKKASCFAGCFFLYLFRPRSMALNCAAIRPSFLGVKGKDV
jgi:hypothetical protein